MRLSRDVFLLLHVKQCSYRAVYEIHRAMYQSYHTMFEIHCAMCAFHRAMSPIFLHNVVIANLETNGLP